MTRVLTALIVTGLALISCGSVRAHAGPWYWPIAQTQKTLKRQGIQWTDGSRSTVTAAHCVGVGRSIRRKRVKMFKHFTCHLQSLEDDPFTVRFHVLGKTRWSVTVVP